MSQALSTDTKNRLQLALFSLRLGVFIVMLMWTIDKFANPDHTAAVFKIFYGMGTSTTIVYVLGVLQLILILAFMAGVKKRITYGLIFILHGASTLSAFGKYFDFNLLFFAAWPMWAACFALYLLRDEDVKFTL